MIYGLQQPHSELIKIQNITPFKKKNFNKKNIEYRANIQHKRIRILSKA